MDQNILDLLYELKKKCILNDDAFMAEANLSYAEYNFFIAINKCDEINSNIIAKKMGLSLSRISRVIDKLVNRNFLTRKPDSSDRRAIKLVLTKEGENLKNQITEYRKKCEYKIINNVSAKKLTIIKESLKTVLGLL